MLPWQALETVERHMSQSAAEARAISTRFGRQPSPQTEPPAGDHARRARSPDYAAGLHKSKFPPATGPLCARASENSHGRVDKTVPAQAESARFDVATTPDELVAATRQAIADATAFDARDINRNFDYDYDAYGEVKRNLGRLVASGQLRLAMQVALDLMKRGSHQVGMSATG